MYIVDAHQDLAYNMLNFGRDYRRSAAETRRLEAGLIQSPHREDTLLGWPDYQEGQVAVIFATLFAAPQRLSSGEWEHMCYANPAQANNIYRQQLDEYHRLAGENPNCFSLVRSGKDLTAVLRDHQTSDRLVKDSQGAPVGLVLLMEGAEGIAGLSELVEWWEGGVRIIGPAWAGNQYCGGTREPGRLTSAGQALFESMAELGFGLDLSHMDEPAARQALDIYPGTIIASHSNALSALKGMEGNRHLSDRVIEGIIERNGVIGILPFNAFLKPGWKQGDRKELVTLNEVIAQIDAICQMAGNSRHVGIGSDFDGGFGAQSTPLEIDTIADLQQLSPRLAEKGYTQEDIAMIFSGNWIRILETILP